MSYDVTLDIDTGGPEPAEVFWRNYTSNMSGLWDDLGAPLRDWEGKAAGDLIEPLEKAVGTLAADLPRFRSYNAPNGWGDADGVLEFLTDILQACRAHPKATLSVWR